MHAEPVNWLRYAKFEQRHGAISNARQVYERAIEYFGEDNLDERILIAFAKFEEAQKEVSRCFAKKISNTCTIGETAI